MSRPRVPTKRSPRQVTAGKTGRDELVVGVLAEADVAVCVSMVLRWLSCHADVEASLFATVDEREGLLMGLAGDGVSHARVERFEVDLARGDHPLMPALAGRQTVGFTPHQGSEAFPRTPLGEVDFYAIPIDRPEAGGEWPLGLLLCRREEAPDEPITWAAELLAMRLLCSRYEEARHAERRARRERQLLSGMLNAVTDPIILTDAEGRMLLANTQAESLLSLGDESSEGRRRAVALNNMLFSASLFTATAHGGPARRELLLVDPTKGHDLLFELITSAIQDAETGVVGSVSILRDVQDLRRATEEIERNYRRLSVAEAEVRAERDRLDLIIHAVADPVLVTNEIGNIVLLNPPAERLFTAPPGSSGGSSERHIRANDVVFSSFVSRLHTMQALRLRSQIELADPDTGRALPVEATAGKVISKQGEVAGVVTTLHDRSEALEKVLLYEQVKRHSEELSAKVREATAELSQQNEVLRRQALALEEASQAKSRFLANMSHELRTPLNAIVGYTYLLIEGLLGELEEEQREKLVRIEANARHLESLINDLLDIERIESGHMPVHVDTFDVSALLGEIVESVEALANRSRLALTADVPADLPPANNDAQKVKQVLLNLLSNAVKFTPEGFVRVQCTYSSEHDHFAVSVTDTGIGIPEEKQAAVFEEFQQLDDSRTRSYGGTGLGLAISRRLAGVIGGAIELVSTPGAGSTFTLTFPREHAS